MPERYHCDRCGILVEERKSWVEISSVRTPDKNLVIHIAVLPSGGSRSPDQYCNSCWKEILRKVIEDLS